MRVKIQVVIEPAAEKSTTTEVATIDRAELDAGSLGLRLSEAKAILKGMQETIVTS